MKLQLITRVEAIALSLAAFFAIAFANIAGCSTTSAAFKDKTPQEVAATVCPIAQSTFASLSALNGLADQDRAHLQAAGKVLDAVCAPGMVPAKADIVSLVEDGAPFAVALINASSLPPEKKDRLIFGVMAAQVTASGYIATMQALK